MKWIQLHSNCLHDPKIVKLLKAHGITGFGLYKAINTLIAERDSEDLTLEHSTDDLEALFNTQGLQPIIDTCLTLGLFTRFNGQIQNLKILKYVGNWQKRTNTYRGSTEGLQRPSVQKERSKEVKKERMNEKSLTPNGLDNPKAFFKAKTEQRKAQEEATLERLGMTTPIPYPFPTALQASQKAKDRKDFLQKQLKDLK